jgi:hypothetical protein
VRDALLRSRGIKRIVPHFSVACIITLSVWYPFMMTINWLLAQSNTLEYMSFAERTAAGCWLAFAFKLFAIFVEFAARMFTNKLFGWDEGHYDRVVDYYENP